MGIQFKKVSNGISCDVNFIDKLNIIKGASGTGKTFLFNVIYSYCTFSGIKCAFIDYRVVASGNTDLIFEMCKNKSIVILDNADLYLTQDLFSRIRTLDCTVIVSKKSTFGLDMRDVHLYTVNYSGDSLSTVRRM